jgi:predicted nucleic acid-binding protein
LSRSVAYLDASALVKLAAREPESHDLTTYLADVELRTSSRVAMVELSRAAARHGPEAVAGVAAVFEALAFIELDAELAAQAASLPPVTLRSLDAIHVVTAMAVGESLVGLVTYDARLSDAARRAGLPVVSPGRS